MIRWLMTVAILCLPAFATTRYVAATAGIYTGSAPCNGQTAITVATWNATVESGDDITWACGTFTGTAGQSGMFIFPSSGTSGHPIVFNANPDFNCTSTYWGQFGCLNTNGKNFLTLNGQGNGIIQSTAMGTNFSSNVTALSTTCGSNLVCTSGIYAGSCGNCLIENWTINNIYVNVPPNDESVAGQGSHAIFFNDANSTTITGNTIHDVKWAISTHFCGNSNWTITNNTIYNIDHGVAQFSDNSSCTLTTTTIAGNTIHDWANWDDATGANHHNGIHVSPTQTSTTVTTLYIYNEYHYGDTGSTADTGHGNTLCAFIDGQPGTFSGVWIFNNVCVNTGPTGDIPANGFINEGTNNVNVNILNNTLIGNTSTNSNSGNFAIQTNDAGANHATINNNIIDNFYVGIQTVSSSNQQTSDYNDFFSLSYFGVTSGGTYESTLATWQSGCSCDSHSVNSNPNLNSGSTPPYQLTSASGGSYRSGKNLTSLGITLLDTAAEGHARPSSSAWDIGAYYFTGGSYTITVSSITGNGTVTSSDSVINCTTPYPTGTCTDPTASGTVTLTETTTFGLVFTGWGGGTCSGTASTCAITAAATVTASFTPVNSSTTIGNLSGSGTTVMGTGSGSGVTVFGAVGPPNFQAYTGQNPVAPTSFPNWGGQTNNGLVWTDPSYPSGSAASVQRCVDGNTLSDHPNFVLLAGRGGASQGTIYFERQSNFMILETNGGTIFGIQINPSTGACTTNVIKQNYSSICPTTAGNNTCSATATLNFNSPFWSQKTNGTLFAQGSTDSVDNTTVLKYTINTPGNSPNTCAGGATVGCYSYTTIAHLVNGLPYAVATAWAANTTYPFGTYITASPAAVTWTANDPNLSLGDIVNIPSCAYFKVTAVTGATGGTAPNWAAHCNAASSVTDNLVTWRSLGSNSFLFQCVTSPNCISGSSQPTFLNGTGTTEMPNGHPDMATITADATGNWQNSGLQNVTVWTEFGGMGLNENLVTWGASNNTYGQAANNRYAVFNGDQNTAAFALVYNISANTFRLFNTQTNMITQTVCTGGTGVDCTGGTWTWSALGQVNAPCFATMHEISNTTGTIATVGNLFLSGAPCNVGKRYWNETQAVFNANTAAPISVWNVNHWTTTNNYSFNWNSNGWSDSTHGIWATYSLLSNQALNPPAVLVIGSTNCKTSAPFTFPPCSGSGHIDTHTDSAYLPDGDFDPIMGTGFATDGVSDNLSPDMAWQGEAIIVPTNQSTTSPGASPVGFVWREGHVCGWGTSPTFSQNQCISQNSTDGRFMAVSSDCQGTCGSTAGTPPTCCGTGANQISVPYVAAYGDPATITCIGGRTWLPGNNYVVGNLIQPENSYANGTTFNVFQATACTGSCTSGTTKPAFGTVGTTGQTIVDNQVTWTNVNNGNCMGTVLLMSLK